VGNLRRERAPLSGLATAGLPRGLLFHFTIASVGGGGALMAPALLVDVGLRSLRHPGRSTFVDHVAGRARHTGATAIAAVRAFPGPSGMVFTDPAGIRAEDALHGLTIRSGSESCDRSTGSCRSTKSCNSDGTSRSCRSQRQRSSAATSAETSRDQPSVVLNAKMPTGFLYWPSSRSVTTVS
jgi:hypothetical protein